MIRSSGHLPGIPTTDPSALTGAGQARTRYRLAYVTRGLPHYRVPFVQSLANAGVECDIFLAGHLADGFIEPDMRAGAGLSVTVLRPTIPRWRTDVIRAVQEVRSAFILLEHGASLDFTWSLLLTRQLAPVPRILWTHGIERRELYAGRRNAASVGRWWQLKLCDAALCYDEATAARLAERFPQKVVGVAPNSTDGRPLLAARRALAEEGRAHVRARHGMRHAFYLVALGRIVPEKAFHRVVSILTLVRAAGLDAAAIFVGAGSEQESIRRDAARAGLVEGDDVIFTGGISDPDRLAEWLYCADLCVNPGCLGLSVVDCLFSGVPVLAPLPGPRGPFHGPEWSYLTPGTTGWFTRSNRDQAMADQVIRYLRQEVAQRLECEEACVAYAWKHLGVERMVEGLFRVIEPLAARAPRRQRPGGRILWL